MRRNETKNINLTFVVDLVVDIKETPHRWLGASNNINVDEPTNHFHLSPPPLLYYVPVCRSYADAEKGNRYHHTPKRKGVVGLVAKNDITI